MTCFDFGTLIKRDRVQSIPVKVFSKPLEALSTVAALLMTSNF